MYERIKNTALQAYAHVYDLFLSMTLGNRIIALLLVAVLLLSVGYLLASAMKTEGQARDKYEALYNGRHFSQNEQKAIIDVLGKNSYTDHIWRGDQLYVAKKSEPKYVGALAKEKAIGDIGTIGVEGAEGIGVLDGRERTVRRSFEIQKKVVEEAIVTTFSEIASAAVLAEKRGEWDRNIWHRKEIKSVAVTIVPTHFKRLPDSIVYAIANIVSMSFGITDTKNEIRIIDGRNHRTYNGKGEEISGGATYLTETAKYQDFYQEQISRLLNEIPGAQIETAVKLKQEYDTQVFRVQHEKPVAMIHQHVYGRDYLNQGWWWRGRPGQIAQFSRTLIDPPLGPDQMPKTTEKIHEAEHTNALPGTETRSRLWELVPERVSVSIRIPMDYVREQWFLRNSSQGETPEKPKQEELEAEKELITAKTKKSVAKLLQEFKSPRAPDALELVEVEYYDVRKEQEVVLTAWEKFQLWLVEYWQTLGLMSLVFAGLVVLWSMTRPAKPDPIVIYEAPEVPLELIEARARAQAEAEARAQAEVEEEEKGYERTLDSFDKSIRSLKEEIAELVAENPEAAAAVLRQWIGNVVFVEKNQ